MANCSCGRRYSFDLFSSALSLARVWAAFRFGRPPGDCDPVEGRSDTVGAVGVDVMKAMAW
jgi:hypothetical protein